MFKPKGLTIYTRATKYLSLDGRGRSREFVGYFKTKGRTGAKGRAEFARMSEYERQKALTAWAKGHSYRGY